MEKLTKGKYNRWNWTPEVIAYLKANGMSEKASVIAEKIGTKQSVVHFKLYTMGLRKQKLQRWTPEQVQYLLDNYTTKGDKEIAADFSKVFAKEKGWSLKHIEKKRRQMGLKHTPEMIVAIRERNLKTGNLSKAMYKRWHRDAALDGTLKVWPINGQPRLFIKIKGTYTPWNHWYYTTHIGPVPKGKIVTYKNGDATKPNPENLELITRQENMKRNSIVNYPPEIHSAIMIVANFNKKLRHEKQNRQPAHAPVCHAGSPA